MPRLLLLWGQARRCAICAQTRRALFPWALGRTRFLEPYYFSLSGSTMVVTLMKPFPWSLLRLRLRGGVAGSRPESRRAVLVNARLFKAARVGGCYRQGASSLSFSQYHYWSLKQKVYRQQLYETMGGVFRASRKCSASV